MPSNHLILCRPLFLLPSIFPSIRLSQCNRKDATDKETWNMKNCNKAFISFTSGISWIPEDELDSLWWNLGNFFHEANLDIFSCVSVFQPSFIVLKRYQVLCNFWLNEWFPNWLDSPGKEFLLTVSWSLDLWLIQLWKWSQAVHVSRALFTWQIKQWEAVLWLHAAKEHHERDGFFTY